MAQSTATATWHGSTLEGSGQISTTSNALTEQPITWKERIGEIAGTTPEELLASAHASCYAMALSFALSGAGHTPEELEVTATAEFGPVAEGFAVTGIALSVDANVPGLDEETFVTFAEGAKTGCPISKALAGNVPVTLRTRLLAHS